MITFTEYQISAVKTAIYGDHNKIFYPALGLAGEAGEVCNKVKKIFRDNNGQLTGEKREELAAELGDVLWYCAALANDLGLSLDIIARMNIIKLNSRKEAGTIGGSGDNR